MHYWSNWCDKEMCHKAHIFMPVDQQKPAAGVALSLFVIVNNNANNYFNFGDHVLLLMPNNLLAKLFFFLSFQVLLFYFHTVPS